MPNYYITNSGCDDTTYKMVDIDIDLHLFLVSLFKEINSNATTHCQPTIEIQTEKEHDAYVVRYSTSSHPDPFHACHFGNCPLHQSRSQG